MASLCLLPHITLQQPQFNHLRLPADNTKSSSVVLHRSISRRDNHRRRPVIYAASLSNDENPSISTIISNPTPTAASPTPPASSRTTKLPVRKIPGDYGWPFFGPIKDRLDYFYFEGTENYFKNRVEKHNSTVFRANMPPGPFIAKNPNVIILLDAKSFPILFDVSQVDKTDLFTGTFMPSTKLTGGYRVLSYLDPSESQHAKLKNLLFTLLQSRRDHIIPEFETTFTELFHSLEAEVADKGKAPFGDLNDQACFNFLARALYSTNPADTKLGNDGPKTIQTWILFQISPILSLGLPFFIEEPLIHTFPLPPFLVKSSYQKLYDFFFKNSTSILDEAEKMGLKRDEACHNILFATCFNTFGGMKVVFPSLVKWIGGTGLTIQKRLADEIRSVVKANGGKVTMKAMEQMPLMKSVVYETFRIDPPVPLQYARAKKDLMIESHEWAFQVKKGEMMFGYQPFATRDSKVFEKAEEFVGNRFMGVEGEKLLKYVMWSNGLETENPTVDNKQCAGKDFVVLIARLLVVELFLRYDSFTVEIGKLPIGSSVTLTSLKRATS